VHASPLEFGIRFRTRGLQSSTCKWVVCSERRLVRSSLSMDKSCYSSLFMLIGHRQPAAGVHDALCMHCIMAPNLAWKAIPPA